MEYRKKMKWPNLCKNDNRKKEKLKIVQTEPRHRAKKAEKPL